MTEAKKTEDELKPGCEEVLDGMPESNEAESGNSDTESAAEPEPELTPEEALQQELAEAKDQTLRTRADFDNYRKRMAREMERVRKTAAEMIIHDILPGIDNLDLALQHAEDQSTGLAQGVQMVFKQLQEALEAHGLKPIESLGKPFDPNVHEAVSQIPSDEYEKDHVAKVFQTGYTLGDVVLRPSKVVVSTGSENTETKTTEENNTEQSASAE